MKTLRRACLYTCLFLSIALAIASIAGSLYRSPEAARLSLFASPLAIALWVLFVATAAVTIAVFPSLRRSPVQLAVHLAPPVIVLGAMWGSVEGLELRGRLFGARPLPPGKLIVAEGGRERRLMEEIPPEDPDHAAVRRGEKKGEDVAVVQGIPVRIIGELPFEIELARFTVEWYEPEPYLFVEWSIGPEDEERSVRRRRIPIIEGRSFPVPEAGVTVAVLRSLRSAVEEGARPILEFEKDGEIERRTPSAGEEIAIDRLGVRIRVVRLFSNFRMRRRPEGGFAYDDAPGPAGNPACQIEIDGESQELLLFQNHDPIPIGRPHADPPALPCRIRFRIEGGTGRAVEAEGGAPALLVRAEGGRGTVERWLFRDADPPSGAIDLEAAGVTRRRAWLVHATSRPQPRDFLSRVVVWEGGKKRAEKVVEVNDPLHYGGYHLYQSSYDAEGLAWSLFEVVPDAGLPAVYAGFLGLAGGLLALQYIRPALRRRRPVRPRRTRTDIEGGLAALRLALVALGIGTAGLGAAAVAIWTIGKLASSSGVPLLPIQLLLAAELELCLLAGILLLGRPAAGRIVFAGAFALGIASFILRWISVDHVPMRSLFEVMLTLAMCVFPISRILSGPLRVPGEWIDPFLAAFLLVPTVFGFFDPEPGRLPPALQSPLFLPHVASYMLAYAAMFKAAILGAGAGGWALLRLLLAWTLPERPAGRRAQLRLVVLSRRAARVLEAGGYAVARLGFPLLTIGLLLGAWWAKIAWGDYWSWDPKELWSLASWLAYVAYFHVRVIARNRRPGLQGALLAAGGAVVLATLLWVNLSRLFGGLHSYAS